MASNYIEVLHGTYSCAIQPLLYVFCDSSGMHTRSTCETFEYALHVPFTDNVGNITSTKIDTDRYEDHEATCTICYYRPDIGKPM